MTPDGSGFALMLLLHGGWPLTEQQARDIVLRYLIGPGVPVDGSRFSVERMRAGQRHRIMLRKKLGVTMLTVGELQEHATTLTRAALAELLLLGYATAEEHRSRREPDAYAPWFLYKKTDAGRRATADIGPSAALSRRMAEEGWP